MFFTQELRFLETEAQLKGTEVRNVSGSVILRFEATYRQIRSYFATKLAKIDNI
jgi:hypothetical protein